MPFVSKLFSKNRYCLHSLPSQSFIYKQQSTGVNVLKWIINYKRVKMFILCFVVSQPLLILSINNKLASVGLGRGVAGTARELSSLRQPALCSTPRSLHSPVYCY